MAARWRTDQDARLRQLYADGAPLAVIASELGRSEDAVGARRAKLGLSSRRRAGEWSELRDAVLREATRAGVPATELARRVRRPVEKGRARRRQLGLGAPPARRYTPDDDAALRATWASGGSLVDLAGELGRNPQACFCVPGASDSIAQKCAGDGSPSGVPRPRRSSGGRSLSELRDRGDRAVLVLERRLGRSAAALRRAAERSRRPDQAGATPARAAIAEGRRAVGARGS
jgi:hypothetical protein